jgi:RNA polymerase sigma-70 factor (family 1)
MHHKNVSLNDPSGLFQLFQEGDEHAFNILYRRHFARLYAIIHGFVGQRELAEDIVFNAFAKLYAGRAGIGDPEHIYGFLFVVARNEAVGHLRNQKRQRLAKEEHAHLAETEYSDPLEAELDKAESMGRIKELVDQLPPARQHIFRLHFFEGRSVREISNQLKLTETTVRNQRNRALIFLRESLLP